MKVEIIYYFEKDDNGFGAFIVYDEEDSAVLAIKHKEQYSVIIHDINAEVDDIFYKPSEEVIIVIENEIDKYKENEEIEDDENKKEL